MKLKKSFALILVLMIFLSTKLDVYANAYNSTTQNGKKVTINITSSSVEGRENQTNVSGVKPVVTSNDIGLIQVNNTINSIYDYNIKSVASARAKSINYSYTVYESKGYISIVIISKVQNATEYQLVDCVTFSTNDGKVVKITDVLGGKPIDVVTNYANKSTKYDKEITLDSNASFYLDNGKLVLAFDAFTLDQSQSKVVTIQIDLTKIISFQLPSNEYYVKDKFNTRMIPLRKVSEGLYYDVAWINKTRTFTVKDATTNSVGSVNNNQYTVNSRKVRLEYKPDIFKGNIYVPISYFTDVLGLSYKIDGTGNITFYKVK